MYRTVRGTGLVRYREREGKAMGRKDHRSLLGTWSFMGNGDVCFGRGGDRSGCHMMHINIPGRRRRGLGEVFGSQRRGRGKRTPNPTLVFCIRESYRG